MLKKTISRLFLGLMVCASSAYVTPTYASSSAQQDVVITRIQASGEFGAKDEYIVLYNNSSTEVDATNWCIANKATILFACFTPIIPEEHFYIPAFDYAVLVSQNHAAGSGYPEGAYSVIYEVTNQSSGSIVNSSDSLSLINAQGIIVDATVWTSAIPTGKSYGRFRIIAGSQYPVNIDTSTDWALIDRTLPPKSSVEKRTIPTDIPDVPLEEVDPNQEQPTIPQVPSFGQSTLLPPLITEIMANPSGADSGREYIELYNPNPNDSLLLTSFKLHIGIDTVKSYSFPAGATIPALGYVAFSNQDIPYTLVNTTGRVQLVNSDGVVIQSVEYVSPKDDYAWALIDGVWLYTKQATPGMANSISPDVSKAASGSTQDSAAKPCASNQYRNPETGRCKLISATSSTVTPCKANQERNPETNRCRNIVAASSPAPCKAGQERNPETNRCRNIVKMSGAAYGVKGVQNKADTMLSWYYWAAIIAIVLLILGYGVWEWRQELVLLWARIRKRFAKQAD